MHTCHKLWTRICEIMQNFTGDLTKICEIFLKITLELPQYSLNSFFLEPMLFSSNGLFIFCCLAEYVDTR